MIIGEPQCEHRTELGVDAVVLAFALMRRFMTLASPAVSALLSPNRH
jgi:hypothetical protein